LIKPNVDSHHLEKRGLMPKIVYPNKAIS